MFSKACEHGIKAMVYIATCSIEGKRVKTSEIAAHAGSPEAFTAKVLGALTRHGLLDSLTGPQGGFAVDLIGMKTITLGDLVRAIDGDGLFTGCGLGLAECNHNHPCPMHDAFMKVRSEISVMLNGTTLHDLAVGLKSGKTVLLR